ncbi:MAG: hypothetical protein JRG96_13880 [Deltaproteobacteria bacterium]|nr:hypothetical protein [Deltaproteobacteria bacterium]MBW2420179.1 hypothetical protein [Deltaproteobacteria bacterium]
MRHVFVSSLHGIPVALLLAAQLVGAQPLASDDFVPDDFVPDDVIHVQLVGREIYAFAGNGSGRVSERLLRDEELLWKGQRGRIGVAITDQRILAATPNTSSWRGERFRVEEVVDERARVGPRVAVFLTNRRVLGFHGTGSNWVEANLGLKEEVLDVGVGNGPAVVVTNRRLLGLSHRAAAFFEQTLELKEEVASVDMSAAAGSVTTDRRVLVFLASSGRWTSQRLPLE